MKPVNRSARIFSVFIPLLILACSVTYTSGFATATGPAPTATGPAPTATGPVSTPTNPPLFVFSTQSYNETGQDPSYTINIQFPAVIHSDDLRASTFNDQMYALMQTEIAAFKTAVAEAPKDPAFAASSIDGMFSTLFQNDRVSSIKLEFIVYISGAAHPYNYSRTVNYDFNQSRSLSLEELFIPGSNYLEVISNFSRNELSQRDFDVFTDGITPTAENYRNWNITSEGLLITFDQYQVAAGAFGQQIVVVPYGILQSVIQPQGPLAGFSG